MRIDTMLAYDKKWLIGCIAGLIGMSLAMKLTGGTAFLLIFPLIFVAFGRNRTELLLYFLLMSFAMTMANANIVPKNAVFGVALRSAHFLIAGVMGLQLVAQRNSRLLAPMLALLAYLGYMAITASQGWQPLVSYLKLLLFTVTFLGFYSVANAAATRQGADVRKIRSVMLSFAAFFVLGSVALLPLPGISMMNAAQIIAAGGIVPEGSLFMGMTLHSQALGPIVAIFSTVLLVDLLFSVRHWDKFYLLLLLCSPVLIYKTASRTAMGTYLAGVCFAAFIFMMAHGVGARWKNRALSTLAFIGVLLGVTLFAVPQMRERVAEFVLKYTTDGQELDVSWESVTVTRQGLMNSAMDNFRESPVIGNGFQVSRQMAGREIVSWKQLLSAPIEKGVWVTAILEEGGVIGMLLYCLFLVIAFCGLLSRQAFIGACALFVFVVNNFGEFTFFSMSYAGGVMWAMVFVGIILDAQRLRQARMRQMNWGAWGQLSEETVVPGVW